MKLHYSLYTLGILFTIAGCKREEPTQWDIGASAALGQLRLGLDDIVPSEFLYADETELWHLRFSENLTDFDLDELVTIPDTTIKNKFAVPLNGGPFTIPNGTNLINMNEDIALNLSSVELKEVRTSGGMLEYVVKSHVNAHLNCVYTIPGLTLNGEPTVWNVVTTPGTPLSPSQQTGFIDLSGYTLMLTGENGNSTNTVASHVLISTVADAPTPAIVSGQDSVVVELKFIDPKVAYARGYFGQQTFAISENVDFSEDFNFPTGQMDIDGVTMNFRLENYIGADAQMNMHQIGSFNVNTNTLADLNYQTLYQPLNITRAVYSNEAVVPSVYEFEMDPSNSDLDLFIENLPTSIQLDADFVINPLGNVSANNDFIFTDQALNAWMELDVPLNVAMSGLMLSDTLELDNEAIEGLTSGVLHLYIENAFPMSCVFFVRLVNDDLTNGIFLSEGASINAAATSSNPPLPNATQSTLDIDLSNEQIRMIQDGYQLIIDVLLNTPEYPEHQALYSTYYLDVKATFDSQIQISVE